MEEQGDISVFQRIHEGEFRYYGEMYDIVYKETIGDTTYYHCIHDKEEEVLFAGLSQAINIYISENPVQQKKQSNILQHLIKEYLPASKPDVSLPDVNTQSSENNLTANYKSRLPDYTSPPPELS